VIAVLIILTSSRAVSLKNVSMDIAKAANRIGVDASWLDRPILPYEARKKGYRVVIVMCADPMTATNWFLLARDLSKGGAPNIFYATVEGKINKKHVQPWMKDVRFIANSLYTAGKISEAGLNVLDVVYHGIDMEIVDSVVKDKSLGVEYMKKFGVDPDKHTVVLTVSNSHPRKGLSLYDKVISYIENRDPSIKFFVLTEEKGLNYFKKHSSMVISTDFGKLPRETVLSMIASAHVLAVPSLAEGFGLPVLEAMALGTPVVHTELPPLMEFSTGFKVRVSEVVHYDVVKSTLSGIIFEHHIYEPEEYAEVLLQVVDMVRNRREELESWRAKSREVAEMYDIHKLYPTLIKLVL